MDGPSHYADAQTYAEASVFAYQKWCTEGGNLEDFKSAQWQQAQAQVHATLALAAATALAGVTIPLPADSELATDWNQAIGVSAELGP